MDVKNTFDVMTVDELREFLGYCSELMNENPEAPPVDTSWLITEDQVRAVRKPRTIRPCGHVQSATLLGLPCQACPEPPVPPKELWENVPQPAEPKTDDLRVTIKPGIHWGVWFSIEKYQNDSVWHNEDLAWREEFVWKRVDKHLYSGFEHGNTAWWGRDENHAQERAAKFIGRQDERVAKYNARKDRIKNGTYTYNINPDR